MVDPSCSRNKRNAWGEHPPTRTGKRGRTINSRYLHVWLNRCADGLTRRYCDAYGPPIDEMQHPSRSYTATGQTSSVSHLQAREDDWWRHWWAIFAMNLCEVKKGSLAEKREEKKAERAGDIIASPSCYSPKRASHFTGPPFVCSPQPTEKVRPTCLRRGKGLISAVPGRRERGGGGGRQGSTNRNRFGRR